MPKIILTISNNQILIPKETLQKINLKNDDMVLLIINKVYAEKEIKEKLKEKIILS